MVFELFCYAVAIVGVLAFVGQPSRKCEAIPDMQKLLQTSEEVQSVSFPVEAPVLPPIELDGEAIELAGKLLELWVVPAGGTDGAEVVSPMPAPCGNGQYHMANWNSFDRGVLRQECQKRGIRWRNAHGRNKHMSKAEMVAALEKAAAAA